MKPAKWIGIILICGGVFPSQGQDKPLTVNGYIKDLASWTWLEGSDSISFNNLIHNRINLSWYVNDRLSIKLEIRNRLFMGNQVRYNPFYPDFIDVNDDYFDLSKQAVSDEFLFHTMIDRAYAQWTTEKWQVRLGRQRINWGVNLAWNPNDIFNAYSLLDFDYQERPGSDAIRIQRFIGFSGGYELAIKMADSWQEITAAGMYKWNWKGYDLQVLSGVMQNNFVWGGGWAGHLGQAGFKGELSHFVGLEPTNNQDLLASITLDYSFANSLYLNGAMLYSSYAQDSNQLSFGLSPANLDVRSIATTTWSTFFQSTYPFHPLVNGSLMLLFFPGDSGIFLGPMLTYSPLINLDVDLISQLYFDDAESNIALLYTRLRYSF